MSEESTEKIWVLTTEYNEYDQFGEYFVAAWRQKPTKDQLQPLTSMNDFGLDHLLKGGGRLEYEYQWYNLKEYPEGENEDA